MHMGPPLSLLYILVLATSAVLSVTIDVAVDDPCAVIGGQKWVAPQDVRACFTSVKVEQSIKANVRGIKIHGISKNHLTTPHRSLKSSTKPWPFIRLWITKSKHQSHFQETFTKTYLQTWLGFNNRVILRISIFISTFLVLWNAWTMVIVYGATFVMCVFLIFSSVVLTHFLKKKKKGLWVFANGHCYSFLTSTP